MTEPAPIPDPGRPDCEPARAAVQRFLDGDPNWDRPEVAAHRAGCVDCREELALARRLPGLLTPPAIPVPFADRVLGAVAVRGRRRRALRYAALGAALAASILVAAVALRPAPQTISESRSVAARPRGADAAGGTKPLGEAVTEARDALVSLTRRTAAETRDTSTSLIPSPRLPDMPDTGDGLEPLADAQAGAARSVEPIRTSARRALNLFLRAADPPNKPILQ
jgi:hypothetical protein